MTAANPRPCAHCGIVFRPVKDPATRQFCSRRCSDLAKRQGQELVCPECETTFYATPWQINRSAGARRYCSRTCWRKNYRLTDEQYSAMADRMSINRRKSPDRPRRSIFCLERKGESSCRNCGRTGRLNLHHAIPRSMFLAGRDELLNGVPLCTWCHLGWHRRCVVLYRDIFTADEWAYLSSVTLLGQNVEAWLDDRYPVRGSQEQAA